MKKFAQQLNESNQSERPFFLFMTLILGGLYIWVVFTTPELRQPAIFILYTLLVFLHIALHWLVGPLLETRQKSIPFYALLQGLLAFIIAYLSNNEGMAFALYLALIGEAFGILRISAWGYPAIGFYLLLSLISYGITIGWENTLWWAVGIIPAAIFVAIYVTLYSRQSEARERAQALLEELQVANRQLADYAAQVEDLTIANERQRMARELHDTLSQGLAGLILQLEAADAHLSHDHPQRAQEIVQQAMERARATLSEARQAIGDLRQGNFASGDLADAIRYEAERFAQATGLPCAVELNLPENIPEEISEPIVRAVSEALTNIARHAHASQASIHLEHHNDRLLVKISDDGCGFDPTTVQPGHYGLLGMGERIRLAGGTLQIHSDSKKGTQLILSLPLQPMGQPGKGCANGR
jgi:NarL family two-component system sensor histidine kinase YdfH